MSTFNTPDILSAIDTASIVKMDVTVHEQRFLEGLRGMMLGLNKLAYTSTLSDFLTEMRAVSNSTSKKWEEPVNIKTDTPDGCRAALTALVRWQITLHRGNFTDVWNACYTIYSAAAEWNVHANWRAVQEMGFTSVEKMDMLARTKRIEHMYFILSRALADGQQATLMAAQVQEEANKYTAIDLRPFGADIDARPVYTPRLSASERAAREATRTAKRQFQNVGSRKQKESSQQPPEQPTEAQPSTGPTTSLNTTLAQIPEGVSAYDATKVAVLPGN